MVYNSIIDLIGNTPIIKLNKLVKELNLKCDIYAKVESFNPAGSIKDRTALYIISEAEKSGKIKAGATIIEATSGNTGIGLAMVCKQKGYKLILTMPSTMSVERQKILKHYGGEIILTDGSLGMQGSVDMAKKLHNDIPNSFIANQFENSANVLAHYKGTGEEIYNDLKGEVDIFVAAVGTGGTFTGTAKYLKEKDSKIKAFAVEPSSSPLISTGKSGSHKIQGIGANFIPSIFDSSVCDGVLTCSDDDAFKYSKLLCSLEGINVGISAGAVLQGAISLAQNKENHGKKIVIILADSGDRYYSTELF